MVFAYVTRNQVPPSLRPQVFAWHLPEEGKTAEEVLFDPLLSFCDCAIWHIAEDGERQDGRTGEQGVSAKDTGELIGKSALVIILVTNALLLGDTKGLASVLSLAETYHVPVVPVMPEPVPMSVYDRYFKDRQFLTAYRSSATEISYREKLELLLKEYLVSDLEQGRILASFRKRAFLSYRKKDRHLVQALMKRIHQQQRNIRVALWYDEYLTPGEDFNREISGWIDQSDVFVLAITNHLLEEGNYVIRHEYPKARELNKKILPILLENVDLERLEECFPGISKADILAPSPEVLANAFYSPEEKDRGITPDVLYDLGIAYLNGVYTEVNIPLGVNAIASAARAEYPPAIEKMSALYRNGQGVQRDWEKSAAWKEYMMDLLLRQYREREDSQDDRTAAALFSYMLSYFNECLEDGSFTVAGRIAKRMRGLCDEVSQSLPQKGIGMQQRLLWARWLENASEANASTGDVLFRTAQGEALIKNTLWYGEKSCRYLEQALEWLELSAFAGEQRTEAQQCLERVSKALIINRQHLADEMEKAGNIRRMQELVLLNTNLLEELDGPCVKYRRLWMIQKAQIAKVAMQIGQPEKAVMQYADSIAIGDNIFEEGDGLVRLEQGIVCDRLADLLLRLGRLDAVRIFVERGLRYRGEVLKYTPDSYDAIHGMSLSEERYGHLELHCRNYREALGWYEACRRRRAYLAEVYPSAGSREELNYIEQCIAAARAMVE